MKPSLPNRPARSAAFNTDILPQKLISNHNPIVINKSQKISLYAMAIEPEIPADARRKIRSVYNLIKQQLEKEIGRTNLSGWIVMATFKSAKPLVFKSKDKNGEEYTVSFNHKHEFRLEDLHKFRSEAGPVVLQAMNFIFKESMRGLNMVEMGRSKKYFYADKKNTFVIENYGIEIRTGFHTNTLMVEGGPKLLIDYFSKILWQGNALDALYEFKSEQSAKDYYIGTSVMSEYGNHRNYRILDIDFKRTPATETILLSSGKEVSLIEYYKIKYDIEIKNSKQPLILSTIYVSSEGKRKEQDIFLVPELCKMTGLNELSNDRQVMKEISPFTKLSPLQRMQKMEAHKQALNNQLEKSNWNIEIGASPILNGYQIIAPKISFDKSVVESKQGLFDIGKSKYSDAFTMAKWLFVYTTTDEIKDNFVEELRKQASLLGFKLDKPKFLKVNEYKTSDDFVKELAKTLTPAIKGVQMVLGLFYQEDGKKLYKPFKQFCSEERSVPSQVVLTKSLDDKKISSVCKKLMLQVYAKMGYSLWRVQNIDLNVKKIMLIGADVYHNTRDKRQSIIGFCSSLDDQFTQYYSRIRTQAKRGEEIMRGISELIKEGIQQYQKTNNCLPNLIVFYRDGVGQGQIDDVRHFEVKNILASFAEIKEDYNPEFIEIVVNKRINDRFFSQNAKKEAINPPSGTLVCEEVVSEYFDFFLCAQNVTQGTCTPTHYTVIYNTSKLKEDQVEKLTYYQCFNYYNWMGAIRVPACVKYADLLAYSVGQILKKEPNEELCKKLYYL